MKGFEPSVVQLRRLLLYPIEQQEHNIYYCLTKNQHYSTFFVNVMVPPRGNDPQPQDFQSYVQTIYTRVALLLANTGGIASPYTGMIVPAALLTKLSIHIFGQGSQI